MQVQTASARVLLAFESEPAAGSAFRPGPLRVFAGEGPGAKSLGPAGGHGFALRSVSGGIHFAKATGAERTTGAFDVTVSLAGDVNGDHQVDAQDVDVIRSLGGRRAGQNGFVPAADVNHNGIIGDGDLRLVKWNLGRSAVVGPLTASQFLFADTNAATRGYNYDPKTMSGISLTVDALAPNVADSLHPIDVDGFVWSVQKPSGQLPVKIDLQMAMRTNAASPLLFKAVVNGTPIAQANLFAGRSGKGANEKPRLQWEMQDVHVTMYETSGGIQNGSTKLEEIVDLSFDRLRITYFPQRPNGSAGAPVSYGWDFVLNTEF